MRNECDHTRMVCYLYSVGDKREMPLFFYDRLLVHLQCHLIFSAMLNFTVNWIVIHLERIISFGISLIEHRGVNDVINATMENKLIDLAHSKIIYGDFLVLLCASGYYCTAHAQYLKDQRPTTTITTMHSNLKCIHSEVNCSNSISISSSTNDTIKYGQQDGSILRQFRKRKHFSWKFWWFVQIVIAIKTIEWAIGQWDKETYDLLSSSSNLSLFIGIAIFYWFGHCRTPLPISITITCLSPHATSTKPIQLCFVFVQTISPINFRGPFPLNLIVKMRLNS